MSIFYMSSWLTLKKIQLQNYKNYTACSETLGQGINRSRYFWRNLFARAIYCPCVKYLLKGLEFLIHIAIFLLSLKIARTTSKYLKIARTTSKYLKIARTTSKYLKVARTTSACNGFRTSSKAFLTMLRIRVAIFRFFQKSTFWIFWSSFWSVSNVQWCIH